MRHSATIFNISSKSPKEMNNLCMFANNGNRLQMWDGASLSVAWYPSGKTEMIWLIGCVGNTPLPPLCCDYDIGLWSSITVWAHKRHGVQNHLQFYCLFKCLFRLPSKETLKLRITSSFNVVWLNQYASWRSKSWSQSALHLTGFILFILSNVKFY